MIKNILPFVAVIIFGVAIYFVWRFLHQHTLKEIGQDLMSISPGKLSLAIFVMIVSYSTISFYDALGFKYLGVKVPLRKVLPTAFSAFAFNHSIGFASVAGSSVRLRLYTHWGVPAVEALKLIAFISVTFWLGFAALAGIVFSIYGISLPSFVDAPTTVVRGVGFVLLFVVFIYFYLVRRGGPTIRLKEISLGVPTLKIAVSQLFLGMADWSLAGLTLYVLLPKDIGIPFPEFLSIYLSVQVIALVSHVPGGLGVLEAMTIYFVSPDHMATPALLAALIAFRAIYYFFPLLLAAIGFGSYEVITKI